MQRWPIPLNYSPCPGCKTSFPGRQSANESEMLRDITNNKGKKEDYEKPEGKISSTRRRDHQKVGGGKSPYAIFFPLTLFPLCSLVQGRW